MEDWGRNFDGDNKDRSMLKDYKPVRIFAETRQIHRGMDTRIRGACNYLTEDTPHPIRIQDLVLGAMVTFTTSATAMKIRQVLTKGIFNMFMTDEAGRATFLDFWVAIVPHLNQYCWRQIVLGGGQATTRSLHPLLQQEGAEGNETE